MYVDIKKIDLIKFNNCKNCDKCCKDKLLAPLVLEDFKKVYNYFPILIAKLDYLKPVMLLSNGISCPYLKNSKCSIYENRPPACKIYPFSPWYDKVLLDLSCDGIGVEGELLPLKDFKNSKFYDERFENISIKLKNTYNWVIKQKLTYFAKIEKIKLYKIEGNDYYARIMKKSWKNLKYYNWRP